MLWYTIRRNHPSITARLLQSAVIKIICARSGSNPKSGGLASYTLGHWINLVYVHVSPLAFQCQYIADRIHILPELDKRVYSLPDAIASPVNTTNTTLASPEPELRVTMYLKLVLLICLNYRTAQLLLKNILIYPIDSYLNGERAILFRQN
jgi:hypothetical protein